MLKDHHELLLAFNEHSVRYLLVGGYALGIYAEPRATRDLDIFVEISTENAINVLAALRQFGAPLGHNSPADFMDPYSGFQVGAPPNQIELIFALSGGISFKEAWRDSRNGETADGVPVRVLSADHFIQTSWPLAVCRIWQTLTPCEEHAKSTMPRRKSR